MGTEKYIFSHLQISTSQEVQRITVRQNGEQVEVAVPQKMALSTRHPRGFTEPRAWGAVTGAGITGILIVSGMTFVAEFLPLSPLSPQLTIMLGTTVTMGIGAAIGWAISDGLGRTWNAVNNIRKTWADAPAFMQAVDEAIKDILWHGPKEA